MAGSNHERVLAAEWLAVFATETFDALSGADTGKFSLPDPSRYFATMVVYLMLAAMAMFGDKAGRLAAAFGGVAALAIVMTPGKNGKKAPIVGALAYFAKIMSAGPAIPAPSTPAGTSAVGLGASAREAAGSIGLGLPVGTQTIPHR